MLYLSVFLFPALRFFIYVCTLHWSVGVLFNFLLFSFSYRRRLTCSSSACFTCSLSSLSLSYCARLSSPVYVITRKNFRSAYAGSPSAFSLTEVFLISSLDRRFTAFLPLSLSASFPSCFLRFSRAYRFFLLISPSANRPAVFRPTIERSRSLARAQVDRPDMKYIDAWPCVCTHVYARLRIVQRTKQR